MLYYTPDSDYMNTYGEMISEIESNQCSTIMIERVIVIGDVCIETKQCVAAV